jgi:hypothetical protein
MQNHRAASPYCFKRAKTSGLILVLNEGSYVMAEYNEHTGVVKWQRVVLATQKEAVERQLRAQYPVPAPAPPPPPAEVKAARPAATKARAAK